MHRAEVGASCAHDHAGDGAFATSLTTRLAFELIRAVFALELATLTIDISVVRHGVTAEVDTFFQKFLYRFEHFFQIFLWNFAYNREWMNA